MTPEQIAALLAASMKVDSGRRLALTDLAAAAEKLSAALPGEMGAGVTRLRDDINVALAGMKPLEMVAGAVELNSALRWFEHAAAELNEMHGKLSASMREMCAKVSGLKPVAELNSMVEAELNALKGRNEIFTKEQLDQAAALARKEGEQAAEQRIAQVAARNAAAEKASLAAPAADVLGLPDADFTARLTQAGAQREKLKTELGLNDAELNSDTFRSLPWLSEGEFNSRLDLLRGYKNRGAAGGTDPKTPIEPLHGSAAPKPEGGAPKLIL